MQISSAFRIDAPNYAPTQVTHRIGPNNKEGQPFTDQESTQRDKFLPTYISPQPPIVQLSCLCKHPVRKPLLPHLLERKRVREDCLPQAKISLCE